MPNQRTESRDHEGPAKRSISRWSIALITVLVLVLLLAGYRYALVLAVEAQQDALRLQGFAVTLEELRNSRPEIPQSENAATLYLEAGEQFRDLEDASHLPSLDLDLLVFPLEHWEIKAIAFLVANNRESLRLIREAEERDASAYPFRIEKNTLAGFETFPTAPKLNSLLRYELLHHLHSGEPFTALQSISSLLALSRSVDQEPIVYMVGQRQNFTKSALWSIGRLLSTSELSQDELGRLRSELSSAKGAPDARAGVAAVIASCSANLDYLYDWIDNSGSTKERLFYRFHRMIGGRELSLLRGYEVFSEAAAAPLAARFDILRKLSSGSWLYLLYVHPEFAMAANWERLNLLHLEMAETLVAVERYRLRSGELPDTLERLVPTLLESVPVDQSSQPIRYVRRESGYLIYSLGRNGLDDGGVVEASGQFYPAEDDYPILVTR